MTAHQKNVAKYKMTVPDTANPTMIATWEKASLALDILARKERFACIEFSPSIVTSTFFIHSGYLKQLLLIISNNCVRIIPLNRHIISG